MPDVGPARHALVARILEGEGRAPHDRRRGAFHNAGLGGPLSGLVAKVALRADTVTDEDIAAVLRSGVSEDEVFEIVVCAAIGQTTREYDAALASLTAASERT